MKLYLLSVATGCIVTLQLHAQTPTLQSVTDNNGNKTTNRIVLGTKDDGFTKLQISGGGVSINSGLSNASTRPAVANGTIPEIRAVSNTDTYADDGFLRLGAGGGTNASTKTYIELSGWSQVADMLQNIVLGTAGQERVRINGIGNVGIGTSNPQAKLDVAGHTIINGRTMINRAPDDGVTALQVNGNATFAATPSSVKRGAKFIFDDYSTGRSALVLDANNGDFAGLDYFYVEHYGGNKGVKLATANNTPIKFAIAETERMTIDENGRVGIGVSNPSSELAVAGTITSKKVRVTATGWPDYVFAPGYVKPSLSEVEQYIRQHRHLPGIPSEAAIVKDGLDVGDMQQKQMQKIEELTLYLIDQQKQIEEQKKLIADQQQLLSALNERLKVLENKMSK